MIITLKGANFASSNIGTLDSWLISKSLTGVTIDNAATSVKKGEAYKAVITLKENYTFPDTITVTMAGTDITSTYVTKTATNITINIPSVTGNIVIKINATSNVVGVTYSITRTLTALTAGSNVNTITSGDTYEETFSIPKDMYDGWAGASGVEVDLTVKMGGSTLAPNTGAYTAELVYQQVSGVERATGFKVTVPNVSGNIAITATSYVPFNESIANTKVYHYTEKDKSIDIDGVSIGDVLIYANVSGAKVHGWKIPAGAKLTVTYKNTKAILSSEAMVLLHITSNNVLDYKSTFIDAAGVGSTSTFTFTNVYNDEVLLEANEGVIVSGRYTVVGGGITPGGGEEPVNLTLYKSAVGNSILDYQNVWKMFGASALSSLGSQIIGVDVSAYAGQQISITAAQSVISGANYAMFCSNLPNAYITSLEQLDGYNSFGTASDYIAESYDNLIESFMVSTVAETTNTITKIVPTNAKYLFFSNLSTKCANPTVVVGGSAALIVNTTSEGWCCMDYQTYFYLTSNATFKGYQSKVLAVDVSDLVGETLSITATQSVVDGAYYSFFTKALPSGISSIEELNGLAYPKTGDTTKYDFADADLVESFNVASEHQVVNTITKVVPAGAKYLFVNTLDKYGSSNIQLVE